MWAVSQKVHARLQRANEAQLSPSVFGDPDEIAEAMVAALPLGHVYDEISGPLYDTSGLTRWLGISRQALHQRIKSHTIAACPLDDGTQAPMTPGWPLCGCARQTRTSTANAPVSGCARAATISE